MKNLSNTFSHFTKESVKEKSYSSQQHKEAVNHTEMIVEVIVWTTVLLAVLLF